MAKPTREDGKNKPKPSKDSPSVIVRLLNQVLGRQTPLKQERSHFSQPEPDREEERRQVRNTREASEIRLPGKDGQPQPSSRDKARRDFAEAYGEDIKDQQTIDLRFKSERARETARSALEDTQALKAAAIDRRDAALDKARQDLDRMLADPRPLGHEAVQAIRDRQDDATETCKRDFKKYDRQREAVYSFADTIGAAVSFDTKPQKLLDYDPQKHLEHVITMPDETVSTEWTEVFNRAAAAETPRPPAPDGIDL